jgi:hypothetical protein
VSSGVDPASGRTGVAKQNGGLVSAILHVQHERPTNNTRHTGHDERRSSMRTREREKKGGVGGWVTALASWVFWGREIIYRRDVTAFICFGR